MFTARSRPALGDLPGGAQRAAADQAAHLVHAREDRVVVGAQAVAGVAGLRGGVHRREIGRGVDRLASRRPGRLGREEVDPSVQHAELAGEPMVSSSRTGFSGWSGPRR